MKTQLSVIWLVICLAAVTMFVSKTSYASVEATQAANAYDALTTYTITRKGKKIGTHELRITNKDNLITVDVTSKIRVTVLKIPVFRFNYSATEKWIDGSLNSVTSTVDENDKNTVVSLQSDTDSSMLETNDGSTQVARLNFTSNHWNPSVIYANRVFNTLTGKASKIDVAFIAEELLGNGIKASHYRYSGDITADTWYDTSGKWVKLSFAGKDGSLIEYTIDQ